MDDSDKASKTSESQEKSYELLQKINVLVDEFVETSEFLFMELNAEENIIDGKVLYEYMLYRAEKISHRIMKMHSDPELPNTIRETMKDENSVNLAYWLDGYMARELIERELKK